MPQPRRWKCAKCRTDTAKGGPAITGEVGFVGSRSRVRYRCKACGHEGWTVHYSARRLFVEAHGKAKLDAPAPR
jgi:hypothetical protein